ncbi:MAG: T9SS type A sorting domain-containing protein [Flavobacteriia bacterium]|nr:T9SS type A sorting domain-containing protein [Flavobacteriia bacterium]OJX37159.1 MAG: hypothetical protein BGO87_15490 [Flavobacteriia bacterium 40-80]
MKIKYLTHSKFILFAITSLITTSIFSQLPVQKIYTDYKGWWTTDMTSVIPDNSHHLLAFQVNNKTYSTGVNDALLTTNGITFIPQDIEAMATTYTVNYQYIGVGYNYGGAGNVTPVPVTNNAAYYLSDGNHGLDLGTAVFNSSGTIIYTVPTLNPASIGDGIPDIFVTQMGDPSNGSFDKFKFIDASGKVIGSERSINMSSVPGIGTASWKFYSSGATPSYQAGVAGTRIIRIVTYEFSDFGITQDNYTEVAKFIHTLSGTSDQAFAAYNKRSITILPVEFKSFEAIKNNRNIDLKWITASEKNNHFFTIEKSVDGKNWEVVLAKDAIGNTSTETIYTATDNTPYPGISYYRLSQTDFDGTTKAFKNIVSVNLDDTNPQIRVFPNPADNYLTIEGFNCNTGNLAVYNISGKNVSTEISLISADNNSSLLDISLLQPGLYFLKMDGETVKLIIN